MTSEERWRPTLGQALALALASLVLVAGLLFALVFGAWRRAALEGAEQQQRAAAVQAGARVEAALARADQAVDEVEGQVRAGIVDAGDPLSLEAGLLAQLLAHPQLAEATLTRAGARSQVSVFRDSDGRIVTRHTRRDGTRFVSNLRERPAGVGGLRAAPFSRVPLTVDDPTDHLTFRTTVAHRGERLWTDLHYTELDSHLPPELQRVVVTALLALEDAHAGGEGESEGEIKGVLRIGLRADQVDDVTRVGEGSPFRVFVCDDAGRLVSRLSPQDRLAESGEDLRVVPARLPQEVALALAHPALAQVTPESPTARGRFVAGGRAYSLTFLGLPRTHGWRVGVLVPEDHYLGPLRRSRKRLLAVSAAVLSVLVAGGALTLRVVRRGLGRAVRQTERMRAFEFAPEPVRSPFRDVRSLMEGLERAKTALRAMSRYVPVDLVRHLYASGQDPVLGGAAAEVTLLFTDIEGFTGMAEELPPDSLAAALGLYFAAMTEAIHSCRGTVDKFIGDAVMALWNAPRPCPDHALMACRAVLACQDALGRLFASPAWGGRPPFRTRFGLHSDRVLVGHFGAPDRMSFTALGDGVNLAARLEGLNKAYGTRVLASESVQEAARGAFAFRLVDVVAVKGKTRAVKVYELLGPAGGAVPAARAYEEAFALYQARRFDAALTLLEALALALADDPPSRVLAERCRRLQAEAPPADWDGVYVATAK